DGDIVTYDAHGNTPITNLTSGASYKIKVIDPDNFQLLDSSGNPIAVSQDGALGEHSFTDKSLQISSVDSTSHTINIAENNFAEGDQVTYNSNGNTAITGLTSGATYKVHVIDADNLQLLDSSNNVIPISFSQGQALSEGAALGVQTLTDITQTTN